MGLLNKKNVIITGATRGIGKGIAELFSKEGANIAFTYRSSEKEAKKIERELTKDGSNIFGFQSDASDFSQAQKLVEKVLEKFGSKKISGKSSIK